MKRLFKCIASLLMLSTLGLCSPKISCCAESGLFAKGDQAKITRHEPKIMSAPERRIPVSATKTTKPKKSPWLLVGLGAAALLGLTAIAAGSGGGDSDPAEEEEGDVAVSW
jgi:hypothetical protein